MQLCGSLSILWHCLSLGSEWKLTFSSPVATAEFSKFAGILGAGGEGDDRGWDGWMASLTRWTWVCVNSGNWWWTGRPGVLRFMGSQRFGHDWETELNWTESPWLPHCLLNKLPSLGLFPLFAGPSWRPLGHDEKKPNMCPLVSLFYDLSAVSTLIY